MIHKPDAPPNLSFCDIYAQEREEIKKRREKQSYPENEQTNGAFVGLALSGGGIRSATFCLGFLQELHRLKLLRIFDYLSTVSGGGYLGGWWSAWLSRSERGVRAISEEPFFNHDDVHHPISLLKQIKEGDDPVSKELHQQLKTSKAGQVALQMNPKELEEWDLLKLTLVLHLNNYISMSSLKANATEADPEEAAQEARELAWDARVKLVDTFPYELRNIFPPAERIEPDRPSVGNEKTSDSSLCAWEDPVHHLRLFANYLTPRKGILSADTWRAISVIVRNLTLTWLILLPLLTGVMLLGQAYFLLNGETRNAYTHPGSAEVLSTAFIQILIPVGVLLVWIVLMGIAWLLCNRDSSSPQDSTVQTTCLIALIVLTVYALATVDPIQAWVKQLYDVRNYFFTSLRHINDEYKSALIQLRLIVAWAIFTAGLMTFLWYWRLHDSRFPVADSETLSRWKREVRRSRFGRAQARLLVITAIVAAVLLLSLLSCFLTQDHFGTSAPTAGGIWRIPITIVPLLSAIGGSIFTAMRATPAANGNKADAREPSMVSRAIFAVSPPLVVCVLAVMAAWFSHCLLVFYMQDQYAQFWEIRGFLKLASILSIALCMGLAIYEMQSVRWSKIPERPLAPIVFLIVLMINMNWVGQAVFRYANESPALWSQLLLSACLGGLITMLVFSRIVPRGKWKWRLFRRLNLVTKIEKKPHPPILKQIQIGSIVIGFAMSIVLALLGYAIGSLVHLSTDEGLLLRASILTVVALFGGVILFRLLVMRTRNAKGVNVLKLHFMQNASFGKRPEALWTVASICLTLPIALISVAHYINWYGLEHRPHPPMMTFPIVLGAFLFFMMVLRSFVIQKWLVEERPMVGWSAGLLEWMLGRIPGVRNRPSTGYQLLALVALCSPPAIDALWRFVSPARVEMSVGVFPTDWRVSAVLLFVSVPVFGVSVFRMPPVAELYEKFASSPRKILHSQPCLWGLALLCVLLAFAAGLLLPNWLIHVSEITSTGGFTRVLLPVASGCFLMAVFEYWLGERDNRRTLNLMAFAFFAIVSIFFLRVAGAGPEWQIVPGLLAAICVWVGALGWMVDPNSVSMHQFYKARLVRAYLGASNIRRLIQNKEITETVAGDDLPLKSLRNCDQGGPYHLINTTLNLVAGRDLSTAQRAASSFVLSQLYCGSRRTNYCGTDDYMNGQLTLGTAVAASGAAVSPNMGAKKPTAALAMLMTLLNVRLGYWAPTPNREGWNSSQPRLWPFYLVREFLSQTNDLSDYCYLTDGGHFDNTGLYSLIERGCRYIVVVDCGADPKPPCFEDLGEAIRRCRIDFGTEIKLNLDPFIECGGKGEPCFAVGKILFSREHLRSLGVENSNDENLRTGTIVYFKPAVMEEVTPDVRQYAIENKNFPQQPTTNQWFGEAQFESYRQLGQLCAKQAFDFKQVRDMSKLPTVCLKDIDHVFTNVSKTDRH